MRIFFCACLVAGTSALAQNEPFARGIDAVPLKLSPTMTSGLILDGAELVEQRSFSLQALADLNFGVLALDLGQERLGDLIPFRADLHLMGAVQVHPRIELAADLPVTVYQTSAFNLLAEQGFMQASPSVAGLGAPRFFGRFQILKQSEVPIVGLAAVVEVRLPLGDRNAFLSDRGVVFAPRLAVERRFGPVRVLGNLGLRLRTATGQFLNLYVGQEVTLGGGAIWEVPDFGPFRGVEVLGEVNLATPAEAPFTFDGAAALKTPFELMLGVRSQIARDFRFQLGVGRGLGINGYGRETFRLTLAIQYVRLAEPDQDGDGIPDLVDRCPTRRERVNGVDDTDGCPDADPEPDRDLDSVPDRVDVCPDEPGPVELDGCPDRDGDQVPNVVDRCPDQMGPADNEGCPPGEDEEDVVVESERIRINNQILFDFGSDRIDPRSYALLDDVAQVLLDNPEVGPVLIEGHTDNIGSREINLSLSKRRARSVEVYLIEKGIDPSRLKSEGYGFDRPVVPNDSVLNRAKNRRTEFKLVEEGTPIPDSNP